MYGLMFVDSSNTCTTCTRPINTTMATESKQSIVH